MYGRFRDHLALELKSISESGLFKSERVIASTQGPEIVLEDGRRVLNFCGNDYLGLAGSAWLAEAAQRTLIERGYGLSSVRFICGTQDIHRELERKLARFLGTEGALLFASCFSANEGFFDALFGPEDAVIVDALNHVSICDGTRLSHARRLTYPHADLAGLEQRLEDAKSARFRAIVTDGVFAMDGDLARLPQICDLAERHGALVVVDESHATGVIGRTGRGTPEHWNVAGRVDVIAGTLGKALGGATGGFIAGPAEIVETLRQRSRPYLFSNSLPPVIVGGAIAVLDHITEDTTLRDRLEQNTRYFRDGLAAAGFDVQPGGHPIVPIMLYDAALSQKIADELLLEGIFVTGCFYPVVPKGEARLRVQLSAGHTRAQLDRALDALIKVGCRNGIIAKGARVAPAARS